MAKLGVGSLRYAGGQDTGMRAARYAPKRRTATKFMPAPILGMNTMDPPEIMKPGYAEELINWWPNENGLTTRGGSAPWAGGFNEHPVESVLVWNAQTAFGFAGPDVFALPGAPNPDRFADLSYTGLTSPRVQGVNFSNDGGTFLHVCNGLDAPMYFDGTAWTQAIFTQHNQPFDASAFFAVTSHLSRLWWLSKDSQSVFYADVNAIQGNVAELPLGAYLRRGGSLVALGVVTQDGLTGSEDLFTVISSEGEVLLFRGTNPDEAANWSLVGHGMIPRPVGAPRCVAKLGPDLVVITESGLVGINTAMSKEFPGLDANIGDKIRSHWDSMVQVYGSGTGWDICVYHGRDLIVINAPGPLGCQQMVVNPNTKAWGMLQGWEQIRCLNEYRGMLVGGGERAVFALDYYYQDTVNKSLWIEGDGIWAQSQQDSEGSDWVRDPSQLVDSPTWSLIKIVQEPVHARVKHGFVAVAGNMKKRFTLARPFLISTSIPAAWFDLAEDFRGEDLLSQMFHLDDITPGAEWYVGQWNVGPDDESGDDWVVGEGLRQVRSRWMQAKGCGYFCAPIVAVDTTIQHVTYTGCDIQYETSNAL